MRTVKFTRLGGLGGEFPEEGTVADLLLAIPYLLITRVVPPLHVVNELLSRGIHDSGMSGGCRWEPLQVDQSEWQELSAYFTALPDEGYEFVQPPGWVETVDDWHTWVMMHKYGLPEEFREASRESHDLERARKKAVSDGDEALTMELHLKVIAAGQRVAELLMSHLKKTSPDNQ